MAGSITSTNAILMLTIPGVYNTPQQLQNFSADDIYDFDAVEVAETMMGVDSGNLAGGRVINKIVLQRISFLADSSSNLIFEQWKGAQDQLGDVYIATMTVTLTSVNRKYNQVGGFLTRYSVAPAGRKVLQPRQFEITWQSVVPAPVNANAF